jgi:transcription factor MBP1
MERGIALSRQYGVDQLLQPIFDYIPTADSPPLAPKHITAPPARPKKKNDGPHDPDAPAPPPKPSRVQATKNAAAKKREAEMRRAAEERAREESEEEANVAGMGSDGRSLSPTPSEASESSETPSPLGSEQGDMEYQQGGPSNGGGGQGGGQGGGARKRKLHEIIPSSAHAQLGTGPLRYARMILDYFVSESTQVPAFLVSPPADFDANVVIDDDGHTALHWACAMGRIRIVKLLLTAGADIFRANSMGQTALMRSVMFTNNYDLRKFPELFELLHRSTINIDRNDRTVFHYIVDIALQKGKTHAARYYIETVLGRLVDYPKEVADILNFQDEEGETALTLAARARSKRLVKILLDNGGDPKVANRDGKSAEDYILEDERFRETELGAPTAGGAAGSAQSFVPQLHSSEVGQRATTRCIPAIVELLEQLATTFDDELAAKERDLAQAHSLLSNMESEIAESERTISSLQQESSTLASLSEREVVLMAELENKMGKRFRLGWEKWVRDEDAREQAYVEGGTAVREMDLDALRELSRNPPKDAGDHARQVRARVQEYTGERKALFREFAKAMSEVGTGVRMGQYRQLIALGCSVELGQVDGVIESLCEMEGQEETGP